MTSNAKTLKCGLVMPISAIADYSEVHWQEVCAIVKEALAASDFSVELVSDSNEIGVIQKRIVQNLYDCDLVICDVSAKNPNVMFELGMRLAFDKPAIIIKDTATTYSFDTAPIEHVLYPRDLRYQAIQAFKQKLLEKALATYEASKKPDYTTFLKHFGEFVVASIDTKPVSKEDFILEELGELRSAVRELARASRNSVQWTNHATMAELARSVVPSPTEVEFVKAFITQNPGLLEELRRIDSASFKAMFMEYLGEVGIDARKLSNDRAERIRRNLLGAVNAAA
ncbi:hypothetical protein KAK07_25005 [Ideonella sp. 4Y16]|uniref:hypothetical protein n=1 Tax=Ideonella alba TaxID=2824118 RepID=UPI001B36444D|nr:hypothetical protein [Ideonella alba]MBQ0946609.1 hypothetical protein [Ideonella alba]